VNSCLSLLSKLEKQGEVKLRPLEKRVHTPKPLKKEKDFFDITDKAEIKGSVKDYRVLLKQVVGGNLHVEWNDLTTERQPPTTRPEAALSPKALVNWLTLFFN